MSEKRHFVGIDHGVDGGSVGVLVEVEGDVIGVLREFKLSKRTTRRVHTLKEGVYHVGGRFRYEIPIAKVEFNEEYFRRLLLDTEYNHAPPRKTWPVPSRDWQ